MRTKPDKIQKFFIWLSIDQNEVWKNMAIAMIAPFTRQCMIPKLEWHWLILKQQQQRLAKLSINIVCMASSFFPFIVFLEAAGSPNRPH